MQLKPQKERYYHYQLSKAGRKFVEKWLCFRWRLVALDVNGSKACEIAGDDIVTIGNKGSCLW